MTITILHIAPRRPDGGYFQVRAPYPVFSGRFVFDCATIEHATAVRRDHQGRAEPVDVVIREARARAGKFVHPDAR